MSNHRGPEGCAPDEIRCEAMVKGSGTEKYWNWTRYDHRCPRRANQTRQGVAVCYIHARVKAFVIWRTHMMTHEYVNGYCKYCGGSPRENEALGESNNCSKAPTVNYNEQEVYIRNGLRVATAACYKASLERGWWHDTQNNRDLRKDKMVHATKIALIHSEISEALEGMRKDKYDDHLPKRLSVEVELSDALIRIFDLAGALGLDLGTAVIEKMAYNAVRADHNRENRGLADGKKF